MNKILLICVFDVDRDETLFGNKFSEKIKASKAIEKHGSRIKKQHRHIRHRSPQLLLHLLAVLVTRETGQPLLGTRPVRTEGGAVGHGRRTQRAGGLLRGKLRSPKLTPSHVQQHNYTGCCLSGRYAKEPFMTDPGVVPFMVHYQSWQRATCTGVLVSRMAVLTACVCVVSSKLGPPDTRPITVVTGTHYRHAMRGIRVPATKIVTPTLPDDTGTRVYIIQKSVALLMLGAKVPDLLTEEPLRGVSVDYHGDSLPRLQEDCVMIGWHFFYRGDKIFQGKKFILQRNMRLQKLHNVNKDVHCDTLVLKYEKAADALGNRKDFVGNDIMCLRDGMYGSPVICQSGRVVGMLLAPDAQWENCTGYSALAHFISNVRNKNFFDCVHTLFQPEIELSWAAIKKHKRLEPEEEHVIKSVYDGLITDFSSSSSDEL